MERIAITAGLTAAALGLATAAGAAGFGTSQPGVTIGTGTTAGSVAVGTGSISVGIRQIPIDPGSFALLGCEIDGPDGPAVNFLQVSPPVRSVGNVSAFSVPDAEGQPCAEVTAQLLRAGLVIRGSRLVVVGGLNLIVYDLVDREILPPGTCVTCDG